MDTASLSELLVDFAGSVGGLATYAPDEYPPWSYRSYANESADALELWARIKMKLKRDKDSVTFIDAKLEEGLVSFENGEKAKGRAAMWEIYNLGLRDFR
jgi:hypothetical protein